MNESDITQMGVYVFLLVLGLLAGGAVVVRAVGALYFQRFRMDTEADFRKMADHPRLQGPVAALEALGFMPMGVLSEKTFYGKAIKSLALASAQAKAFASITLIKSRAVYFYYTPFKDGSVLLTANGEFRPIDREGYFVQTVPYGNPSTLLAAHQERQRFFMAQGREPFRVYTPESRLEAARQFYANRSVRRAVRQSFLRSGAMALLSIALPLMIIVADLSEHKGLVRSDVDRLKWKTYLYRAGGFSVAMPHTPRELQEGDLHYFLDDDGELSYSVAYTDVEAGYIQDVGVERILKEFQDRAIPPQGTLIFEREYLLDDHPGREFRARESDSANPYLVEGRVFLVDRRAYRVLVRYQQAETLSEKIPLFLDSFTLVED